MADDQPFAYKPVIGSEGSPPPSEKQMPMSSRSIRPDEAPTTAVGTGIARRIVP